MRLETCLKILQYYDQIYKYSVIKTFQIICISNLFLKSLYNVAALWMQAVAHRGISFLGYMYIIES